MSAREESCRRFSKLHKVIAGRDQLRLHGPQLGLARGQPSLDGGQARLRVVELVVARIWADSAEIAWRSAVAADCLEAISLERSPELEAVSPLPSTAAPTGSVETSRVASVDVIDVAVAHGLVVAAAA